MSVTILQQVLMRRWYVVPLGLVITLLVLSAQMRTQGVYWTRSEVVLFSPADAALGRSFALDSEDLGEVAAVLSTEYNNRLPDPAPASPDVTLVDEGVRVGQAVRLVNLGGQWSPNFSRPVIDVQVVGPEAAQVERRARLISSELQRLLNRRQALLGVRERDRITSTKSPEIPVVVYHGGATTRMAAATLLLGLGGIVTLCFVLDLSLKRRTVRRRG